MQVSLNWLKEFVDLDGIDEKEIAHQLTMSGLEVEEIDYLKPQFSNIITAKIEKINNHPNADKLHLVDVNTGNGIKTVVCGAQNIQEGQIIPYASVGSKVLDRKTGEQFILTPATIRGVESQGMLCSADELGLSDRNYQEENGILILNRFLDNVELGKNLEDVLNLEEDIILNVAPTANRGDQMSVIGVARELCAIFDKHLKYSPLESTVEYGNDGFEVEIKDEDTCKYYSVGLLSNIHIKKSPDWMQKRLISSGIRAINNVVDITNYVLLELGTPLHAFDRNKLNNYLCVRRANEGETIVTLDGVERKLTHDSVLIADREKGVCLGGVFGGENSEIDDNTTSIALEAAYFTPATNRRSARSVGYRSEAGARFERGIDIGAVQQARMRAMQLLVEYADAKVDGVVQAGCDKNEIPPITLRYSEIKRVLGIEIPTDKALNILEKLGFTILGKNEMAARIEVPSYRVDDVYREIDLIEEIARINGYEQVPPTLPQKNDVPEISLEEKTISHIHELMRSCGLNEIVTTSLIGKSLLDRYMMTYNEEQAVKVANVASEEYSMLRQTLAANILDCFKNNWDNGQKNYWVYEIGRSYFKDHETTQQDSGVTEVKMLSGIISGNIENSKWQQAQQTDFYTLKGIFEKLLSSLGLETRILINPCEDINYMHPYKTAKLTMLGKQAKDIGFFGQIHPLLKDKMKLNQDAYLFEVNLEDIISCVHESVPHFKHLPQYPEVQRDMAFIIPESVTYAELQKVIKKSAQSNLFKGSEIFDVYQGEHIKEGYKSLAFRIKLQDENATLTEEVIEKQMAAVKTGLQKAYSEISFRE
ncbi:phenylalanine--tRNA ligase subunit beta [bacterium]|nr:phenylalanine--tRNA ligase subunit beta [bacterium]